MEKLIIKKSNKAKGGKYYYTVNGSVPMTYSDIYDWVNAGNEIECVNEPIAKVLLNCIYYKETAKTNHEKLNRNLVGDTSLLKRIIVSGGIQKYIEGLNG